MRHLHIGLFSFFTAAVLLTSPARAEDHGPDVRLSGAPGDQLCTACHTGTAVNAGGGNVKIEVPSGTTYTPGVNQRLKIVITDSSARRFGFQLTARLASDLANGQAGTLTAVDANTLVKCDNGQNAPCSSASMVQFASHSLTGYRAASNTYEVDWTPPAAGAGNVRLYVAGNGANGNANNSGDHIYTYNVELSPAAASAKPAISSSRGVVNAASFGTDTAAGTWLTIFGTNLATTTRSWAGADIQNGQLPTALDGVSVSINGKAAYVAFISPTQVNVLSPADTSLGTVEVKITAGGQTSDAANVTLQAAAPAFFTFDGKYVAATHASGALIGKTGLFASAPTATTPAKPGETIILYGTGFGSTDPVIAAGVITDKIAPLAETPTVTIGGVRATVAFAGLVPNFARLYQFNVTVPDAVADGDQTIVVTAAGIASPGSAAITVQR